MAQMRRNSVCGNSWKDLGIALVGCAAALAMMLGALYILFWWNPFSRPPEKEVVAAKEEAPPPKFAKKEAVAKKEVPPPDPIGPKFSAQDLAKAAREAALLAKAGKKPEPESPPVVAKKDPLKPDPLPEPVPVKIYSEPAESIKSQIEHLRINHKEELIRYRLENDKKLFDLSRKYANAMYEVNRYSGLYFDWRVGWRRSWGYSQITAQKLVDEAREAREAYISFSTKVSAGLARKEADFQEKVRKIRAGTYGPKSSFD